MILDGFNNQPVDKIISVAGPQGPPGLSGITQNPRRPLRNGIAAIGDSLTCEGMLGAAGSTTGGYQPWLVRTYLQQLQVMTHQRIRYCSGLYAISDSLLADQQVSQLPNVLAMNPLPGACVLGGNGVDINTNTSYNFATNQGVLKSMVAMLLAAGVVPILFCLPPMNPTADPVSLTTINARVQQWNTWLRRYAAVNGFPLIDAYTALAQVDGTSIPGAVETTGSGAWIHPTGYGHRLIAQQALADGLADIFPPNSLVNTARTTNDLSNLLNNGTINLGLFTTSSGLVATGLTAAGTATNSVFAPAPNDQLLGNWQQMTVAAGNTANLSAFITSGWSVGDKIAFSCRVQTQNIESSGAQYILGIVSSTSGFLLPNGVSQPTSYYGLGNWTVDISDGEVYLEFAIPPQATDLKFLGSIPVAVPSGTATLRFGEVTIRNLTTGGLLA